MAQGTDFEKRAAAAGQTHNGKVIVGKIPSTKVQMANDRYGQHASQFTVQPSKVKEKLGDVKGSDMPMLLRALDPTDLSAYWDPTKGRVVVPYKNVREDERELV